MNSPDICFQSRRSLSTCGNGFKESGETCDDGTPLNNQGCKSDCSGNISGWSCTGGSTTTASICNSICGDGILVGNETCDDNSPNSAGCNSSCTGE